MGGTVPQGTSRAQPSKARAGVRAVASWTFTGIGILAMLVSLVTFISRGAEKASAGPPAAMFGYVPLPANDLVTTFNALNAAAGETLDFTVGITTASQGGIVYYDHWEDGYEADIDTPAQSSTQVWGDANAANGDAGTVCTTCAGDVLTAGDVFVLRNNIPTPRDSNTILWDGRDKIASTRGFAMTAGGWTTSIGSVLAGVVSAFDTSRYGTSFVVPVGTDTPFPAGSSPPFEYTGASIMAASANTNVQVDTDNNGSFETTQTIGAGEAMFVNGGMVEGARIQSNRPVQVHLLTGDINATYEGHFFTLVPTALLTNNYINPVGSGAVNQETVIYLYNPNASAINITTTCASCSGTPINVPSEASAAFVTPLGEAVKFESGGPVFTAIGAMGSRSGSGGQTDSSSVYDWGFSLVPANILTTQVVLGWAPGASDVPPSSAAYDPVWVTTYADTILSVDYDGDPTTGALSGDCIGQHDDEITVSALESTRITDTNDNSMTGARIYTCDGVAVAAAWGEDPTTAPTGTPGLDAGYTVIPTATMLVNKTSTMVADTHGDGRLGPGDTIEYEAMVSNAGGIQFTNVVVDDTLPAGLQYLPDSTVFFDGTNTTPVADDSVPPNATPYPLDETGLTAPNVNPGETLFVRFRAVIEDPWAQPSNLLANTVSVTSDQGSGTSTDLQGLASADLSLSKSETGAPQHVGENAVFDITVSNNGSDTAPDVQVEDLLPAGLTYVSHTATTGTYDPVLGVWDVGDLTNGQAETLSITARVDTSDPVTNVAQVSHSGAADPDSIPANDEPAEDDQDAATVDVLPSADLDVNKVRYNGPDVNGDITYRIFVSNAGPSDATGVALTELPPTGATYVSSLPTTGSYDPITHVWTVGTVAASSSEAIDLTFNIPLDQFPVENFAEITAVNEHDPDSTPAENTLDDQNPPDEDDESSVMVTLLADLSLTKSVTTAPQFVGDDAVFDITVTNDGPDPANDVQVTDVLPLGLSYVADSTTSGSYDPISGVWSLDDLPSGQSATLQITARVLIEGTLPNEAEVTASGAPDPDSTPNDGAGDDWDSVDVTTTGASLGDTVFFDVDGNGSQGTGEPGLAGVNVIVIDAGPNGTLGDGDDVTLPTATTDATGSWTVTGLGPGDYRVNIQTSSLPAGLDVPTADPDGISSPDTADVSLAAGETKQDVDFGYAGAATVGDTVFLDFDGSGDPASDGSEGIEGVVVDLTWAGFDDTFGTSDDQSYQVTSDADGAWSQAGIPAGLVRVDIDESTLPAGVTNYVDPDGGNDGVSEVTVGAGDVDMNQDFGFVGLGGVGELVFRDDNNSSAMDAGEGLGAVEVRITWAGPDDTFGNADDHTFSAITDGNGDWGAGNLAAGSYEVKVVESTLPEGATNVVDPDGGNDSTSVLSLAVSEINLDQNFGYAVPAAPVSTGSLPVTGSTLLGQLVLGGSGLSLTGLGMVLGARPQLWKRIRSLRRVLTNRLRGS